jgi:dCMP deaminase
MNDNVIYERPSWDSIFIEMCETLSKRATCVRIQTASIIQKNNVIVSIGYNGVVSGAEHCSNHWFHYWCENKKNLEGKFENFVLSKKFYDLHHEWSNLNEIHGEMNAILQAGKNGISLNGATIYTLYAPCINCAKSIKTSGIKNVIYKHKYLRDANETGIIFLKKNGVYIEQYNNNF